MFVRRKKSVQRIIHTPNCPFLSSANPEDLVQVEDVAAAFSDGYEMCALCSPLRRKLQAEEETVSAFCRENGLSYVLCNKYIAVSTPLSQWRIVIADNEAKTKLYHRNTIRQERNIPSFLTQYHDQNFSSSRLLPYFRYILHHDDYRYHRPLLEKRNTKPAKKGSKRYRKEMKKEKKREKSRSARKVLTMIENLQGAEKAHCETQKTG